MEAFKTLSKHVQEQEPKTQIYFALQPPKSQELIIVEKYASLPPSFFDIYDNIQLLYHDIATRWPHSVNI